MEAGPEGMEKLMAKRYETAEKAKTALDYGAESAKVLAATAAVVGGYEVEAVLAAGLMRAHGKVVDFSTEGVEIAGHALFGWGYNTLISWENLVTIERYEPGVEAAVEIVKRRAAEAEARAEERA